MSVGEPMARCGVVAAIGAAALVWAPAADAEPATQLERGIASLRAGSCPALRPDPVVQRAAELSNQSSEDYYNHGAQHVPVTDPLLVLTDLGSAAGKAVQLHGYGDTDADAIKGALLQGHTAIVDCSYMTFGSSVIRNMERGYTLVVAVLADR
ncbi:hypothetical protein [Mycolicibacterium pulveris]|uniref:hypothetical protein n=1 Tax=Mycolicibacterium pulveris TaxID=36813 RepID=UPI003CF37067